MLPPPTTTVTDTPSALTSLICRARSSNTCGSMPKPSLPCSASPLSFRTIRLYFGTPEDPLETAFFMDDRTAMATLRSGRFPDAEPRKPPDDDVFPRLRDQRFQQTTDRHAGILHEGLLQQAGGLQR